jgi:hypothetical protein
MARFFIETLNGTYYQFTAPATAYPEVLQPKLGVLSEDELPEDAEIEPMMTGEGYADFKIVALRLTLASGSSRVRLASALAPINTLPGTEVFGSRIRRVRPTRRRVRV